MTQSSAHNHDTFQLVESGYDKIADTYLEWCKGRSVKERSQLIDRMTALLPRKASILELGCGAGVPITKQLVEKNFHVTGVDISKVQIELARKMIPGASFIQANMLSFDIEVHAAGSVKFDAVLAMYSFFHIPLELQDTMLEKMIAWLRPGGMLLFNHNTKEGNFYLDNWMGAPMFSCSPGVEGMRRKLAQRGEEIEILEDKVIAEPVGKNEALFQYILVRKRTLHPKEAEAEAN